LIASPQTLLQISNGVSVIQSISSNRCSE
jgi:hypothetical protein